VQLKQLRQAVENEINLAPDNEVWRRRVRDLLSQEHRAICAMEDWNFLRTQYELTVGPDLDFGSGSGAYSGVTVTYTGGSNTVTASASVAALGYAVGSTFLDSENNQYTIARISGSDILLSNNYAGTDTGSGKLGSIRCLSFPLPQDLDQVLAHYEKQESGTTIAADGTVTTSGNGFIGNLDGGSGVLRMFGEQEDELKAYSMNDTGEPKLYRILEEDLASLVGGDIRQDHELAAAASSGGTLAASTTYRYCYALTVGSVVGPPSNIVEVTTTASNKTVDLSSMKTKASGYRQIIYRAKGEGPFYKIATQDSATSTYSDTGAANQDDRVDFGVSDRVKRIQYYPRPDGVYTFRLAYRRRVTDLVLPHDVPAIPEPYQAVLIHRVAERLTRNPSEKELQRRLGDEAFARLRQAQVSARVERAVRKPWGTGMPRGRWPVNFGIPTLS